MVISKTGSTSASNIWNGGLGTDLMTSTYNQGMLGFWNFQHHKDAVGTMVQLPKAVQSTNPGWTDAQFNPLPSIQCITNHVYPGTLDLWPESARLESGGPTNVTPVMNGAQVEVLSWKVAADFTLNVTIADYVDIQSFLPGKEITSTAGGIYQAIWPWPKPATLYTFAGLPGSEHSDNGFVLYYDASALTGVGPYLELYLASGADPIYGGGGGTINLVGQQHVMSLGTGTFTVSASDINSVVALLSSEPGTLFRWVVKVAALANTDVVSLQEPRLFYVK